VKVKNVSQLKNCHKGRRCFLIGNGPSLSSIDLEKLRNEITFACNNVYLAFSETSWRPKYYTVSDPMVGKAFAQEINALALNKIFSSSVKPYFVDSPDILWLEQIHYASQDDISDFAFSFDLLDGVYHGATTLYIQLQIAFYMGIREVYLLGVDFDYTIPQEQERSGMGVLVKHKNEINHFHPDYRRPGERWWLADKEFQYKTYAFAKGVFEEHGGKILNASRKTALDVFPLVDLDATIVK
jgi:hypothetical protein